MSPRKVKSRCRYLLRCVGFTGSSSTDIMPGHVTGSKVCYVGVYGAETHAQRWGWVSQAEQLRLKSLVCPWDSSHNRTANPPQEPVSFPASTPVPSIFQARQATRNVSCGFSSLKEKCEISLTFGENYGLTTEWRWLEYSWGLSFGLIFPR